MPTPHRQMQRVLDALQEVARRDRILTKAQLASIRADEKAVQEAECLLRLIENNERHATG